LEVGFPQFGNMLLVKFSSRIPKLEPDVSLLVLCDEVRHICVLHTEFFPAKLVEQQCGCVEVDPVLALAFLHVEFDELGAEYLTEDAVVNDGAHQLEDPAVLHREPPLVVGEAAFERNGVQQDDAHVQELVLRAVPAIEKGDRLGFLTLQFRHNGCLF
jgi:hypothetical protein